MLLSERVAEESDTYMLNVLLPRHHILDKGFWHCEPKNIYSRNCVYETPCMAISDREKQRVLVL